LTAVPTQRLIDMFFQDRCQHKCCWILEELTISVRLRMLTSFSVNFLAGSCNRSIVCFHSLLEYSASDGSYRKISEVPVPTMSTVMIMEAHESNLYVGLLDGTLAMYSRPAGVFATVVVSLSKYVS